MLGRADFDVCLETFGGAGAGTAADLDREWKVVTYGEADLGTIDWAALDSVDACEDPCECELVRRRENILNDLRREKDF